MPARNTNQPSSSAKGKKGQVAGKNRTSRKQVEEEEVEDNVIGPLALQIVQQCFLPGREVWELSVVDQGDDNTLISLTHPEADRILTLGRNELALTRFLSPPRRLEGDDDDDPHSDPVRVEFTAIGVVPIRLQRLNAKFQKMEIGAVTIKSYE